MGERHRSSLLVLLCLVVTALGCARPPAAPSQAALEKIDIHSHYFAQRDYLLPMLQRWNMRAVILNYSKAQEDNLVRERWSRLVAIRQAAPTRFLLATTIDASAIDHPGFAASAVARLDSDLAQGAIMVKVWKDVGMTVKDRTGAFVQIDDPRFQPVWDHLVARHIPVIVHNADPRDAWLPLDPASPYFSYYSTHPEDYPYARPGTPPRETVLAARDRWLARNPALVVIGAHLGSMADDLDSLGARLDAYPNFNVDVSARFDELQRFPLTRVRRFFLTYQDRILFGMDRTISRNPPITDSTALAQEAAATELRLSRWWEYVSVKLGLPMSVLKKFYAGNAMRILHLNPARPSDTSSTLP